MFCNAFDYRYTRPYQMMVCSENRRKYPRSKWHLLSKTGKYCHSLFFVVSTLDDDHHHQSQQRNSIIISHKYITEKNLLDDRKNREV